MPTPHKHAVVLRAYAEGATIQWLSGDNTWKDVANPSFYPENQYRVKPEPKPDIVLYGVVNLIKDWQVFARLTHLTTSNLRGDNVRLTFDGETGELKNAEAIQ
jgi:hypothetical protein